jgi:hypothetical protein
MTQVLPDEEGICPCPNHQHRGRVLQNVRVLQGFWQTSGASDRPE